MYLPYLPIRQLRFVINHKLSGSRSGPMAVSGLPFDSKEVASWQVIDLLQRAVGLISRRGRYRPGDTVNRYLEQIFALVNVIWRLRYERNWNPGRHSECN